jgi:hypothetical protein
MHPRLGNLLLFLVAVLAAVVIGCAPPVDVIRDEAELNRSAEGRDVTVVFRDQTSAVVRGFRLEGDSASWQGRKVARSEVVSVFYKPNALPRAVTGFLGGFCIGALIGGVIGHGAMSGEDQGLGETVGLALGGGAAGVIGLSVGLATAPVAQYYVPATPNTKQ